MSDNILDAITNQFGGSVLDSISRQAGLDKKDAGSVLSAALPILVGAMARNSNRREGAEALHNALRRDHDGSLLDNLGGLLNNPNAGPGAGILRHVLGARRNNVEKVINKETGVDIQSISRILEMAAPILMGLLGKQQRQKNLDPGGLSSILQSGLNHMNRQSPGTEGLLARLLDQDGDGDITDDITRIGGGLLGSLFRK